MSNITNKELLEMASNRIRDINGFLEETKTAIEVNKPTQLTLNIGKNKKAELKQIQRKKDIVFYNNQLVIFKQMFEVLHKTLKSSIRASDFIQFFQLYIEYLASKDIIDGSEIGKFTGKEIHEFCEMHRLL